jgi:twinkle protein
MSHQNEIYDLESIRNAVQSNIDVFITTLFPAAKKQGNSYRIGNIDGEKGRSLSISAQGHNAGVFHDHASNESGSYIDLVSRAKNLTIRESICFIAKMFRLSPVQNFSPSSKAQNHEDLVRQLRPLTARAIEYAKDSRKISQATLEAYGVHSGSHGDVIFPHYDEDEKLGMLKHWECSDAKKMWTNEAPIHSLFGKDVCNPDRGNDRLVITEGQWDALSLYELGIPAVSIPSGVSNTKWIDEDYAFLSTFIEIILIFDNDVEGQQAARDAVARLGASRCVIVKLPLKDANDMLVAGRGDEVAKLIETTLKQPLAEIVGADEMLDDTLSYLRGEHKSQGSPFFLPNFNLNFRPHEITLWFGFSTHGKSSIIQNQIAFDAAAGHQTVVASFEQQPSRTLGAIIHAFTCNPNIAHDGDFKHVYDYLTKLIFFYRSRERADPQHLINTFIHAHRRHGVTRFAIDNVMTLDIDRGDNTAQANAMDLIRNFAANYPVHVHVVAHPRKSPDNTSNPPQMSDIRGASEWGDMPDNIIAAWRDMKKAEQIEEMIEQCHPEEDIYAYWRALACGKIITRKQRLTGDHPVAKVFHHKDTKRFTRTPDLPGPMYDSPPWLDCEDNEEPNDPNEPF